MVKKNKSSATIVGHASMVGHTTDKEMRKHAMERYKKDYGFLRGVRVSSPDRDPYAYDAFKSRERLNEHFYGTRDIKEINMMMGKPHGFAHSRTAQDGHSVYSKGGASKKGHRIGKR